MPLRYLLAIFILVFVAACGIARPAVPTAAGIVSPTHTPSPSSSSASSVANSSTTLTTTKPVSSTSAATRAPSSSVTTSAISLRVEVVASHLEVPWALAFANRLPGGQSSLPGPYLFVTERPGRLRLIAGGRLQADAVATIGTADGEGGLLGLALDPQFERNGYMYVYYTYHANAGSRNRISRLTLQGLRAGSERVLLDGLLASSIHDGGRLAFGPDGKLFATVGTAQPNLAQRLDSLSGKILRLNPDGSIPADNPFPGSLVYSYGHRNPQGLAWQPSSGRLYSTENGPSAGVDGLNCCHDELNVIRPGANYGWPTVFGIAHDARFVDPFLESGQDTWAPSGAAFYEGTLFPLWRGSLFFGTLRGEHLHRVSLGGPSGDQVVAEERLFSGTYQRIRDVAVGPDGALYFTTSNRDLRAAPASDDDRILRIIPGP